MGSARFRFFVVGGGWGGGGGVLKLKSWESRRSKVLRCWSMRESIGQDSLETKSLSRSRGVEL